MKRINRYIWLFISITALIISTACSSSVPVNYPTITLTTPTLTTPSEGTGTIVEKMGATAIVDDIIEIPPSKAWHETFEIPSTLANVSLDGWFVASGGARNDIKAMVLDDVDFYNWRNFDKVTPIYQSEKTSVANITADISKPGKYHLVFSNWFSEFSSKKVIAKVYLYYSLIPVTYTINVKGTEGSLISNDSQTPQGDQIPSGDQVTFEFTENVDISNFKITQIAKDGTETAIPVSTTIVASKVTFIAPAIGDYQFTCDEGTNKVNGQFSVVSQPIIGQGLTLSSSSANAPPNLNKIANQTYSSPAEMAGKQINVNGSDTDGDQLTYYAFNIPMVVSGYNPDGSKKWQPAATLVDENNNTAIFTWDKDLAKNLAPGKYFLRFEVSDGILSDSQDVVVEIKK